jgi:putative transposase
MRRAFGLDVLEQMLSAGKPERGGALTLHSARGSQCVSSRHCERVAEAGIEPLVGSRGDRYVKVLAETILLVKALLISRSPAKSGLHIVY